MEIEVEPLTFRTLIESEASALSDFSVGFALPTTKNGSIDASLGGSGTLVRIDEISGILTADHVVKSLRKNESVGLILPSSVEAKLHHVPLNMQYSADIGFPCQTKQSDGPDLALLIPPPDTLSTLKASKSFYNLSKRQMQVLEQPPAIDLGFWILSGFAGEWTYDGAPEKAASKVKLFRGMHREGPVTSEYVRGKFDYLIYQALYNELYEGPDRYGGYSGAGLWQLLIRPDGHKLQVANRLLSGVAFYEMEKKTAAGRTTRDIICHGRKSLYRALIDKVRATSS
jgi:hypothetical protein